MTQLLTACKGILEQLQSVLEQIDGKDFCCPSATLSNATVGQHLRHTLEFFVCLMSGFEKGVVNYDNRGHNKQIENDKYIALSCLDEIRKFVSQQHQDKALRMEVTYERNGADWITIDTNYQRELVYNIEHAVHHIALMKIGIREVAPYVRIPDGFGVAVSTLRYQETAAIRA